MGTGCGNVWDKAGGQGSALLLTLKIGIFVLSLNYKRRKKRQFLAAKSPESLE